MRRNRRSARSFERHFSSKLGKWSCIVSGRREFVRPLMLGIGFFFIEFVVSFVRSFHCKNGRKSVPYHIKHRSPYVPWVCESREKWNYFYRKFGYKRNCCANHHIYVTPYLHAPYNSVWLQGLTTQSFSSGDVRGAIHSDFIFSYYTLMIWFPELFYRFEEFEVAHPGQHASVCEVSGIILGQNG